MKLGIASSRSAALITFISLGMVSLFADITYEGARSVLGSYMEFLKMPPTLIGLVGVAEFLSYLMRLVGGLIATALGSSAVFWGLIFLGYITNFAIPTLALTNRWDLVITLVFIERLGKGLRAPARDAILAEVTEGIGRGKGFGIHELLDQVGAVSGPLLIAWALVTSGNSYRYAFSLLALPVVISLAFLSLAYVNYPTVRGVKKGGGKVSLGRDSLLYITAVAMIFLGFIHWSLIAYHLRYTGVLPDYQVAIAYTVAMLADAVVAVPVGILYDRIGIKSLIAVPLITALIPLTLFTNSPQVVLATATLWGITMGMYETNMRAALADLVPAEGRAYAYGVFNFAVGISWMLGTMLIAYLYEYLQPVITPLVAVVEFTATALLTVILRSAKLVKGY